MGASTPVSMRGYLPGFDADQRPRSDEGNSWPLVGPRVSAISQATGLDVQQPELPAGAAQDDLPTPLHPRSWLRTEPEGRFQAGEHREVADVGRREVEAALVGGTRDEVVGDTDRPVAAAVLPHEGAGSARDRVGHRLDP